MNINIVFHIPDTLRFGETFVVVVVVVTLYFGNICKKKKKKKKKHFESLWD